MSLADKIFIDMCQDILDNGVSTEGEKVRPHYLTLQIYDCSLCIFFFSCKLSYHFLLFYTLCNLKIWWDYPIQY